MFNRFFLFLTISVTTGVSSISCSDDIPECPSRMCIVAGGWQLTEVRIDESTYDGDLSQFRLLLNSPSPATATTSSFSRVSTSGSADEGSWSLENNEEILRLVPDNNQLLAEDWIIGSMTPRKMVLIMIRDTDIKQGPARIELILEPF